MLADARSVADGTAVTTDFCIVGAGPAGLSLAESLSRSGAKVCILGGGGKAADARAQSLCEAETIGDPYLAPVETRRRQIGGNANAWAIRLGDGRVGVRYVPFDPLDFERRPWVPNSGWPITYDDIEPYYRRAHRHCGAGAFEYDAAAYASPDAPVLKPAGARLASGVFHFGPADRFKQPQRGVLGKSADVVLYEHAHCTELVGSSNGAVVSHAVVRTFEGTTFRVFAKQFIVAAGGIETPRLLLASATLACAGNPALGRYHMDHLLRCLGTFHPSRRTMFQQLGLYDLRRVGAEPVMGNLVLTPAEQRGARTSNACVSLMPNPKLRQLRALLDAKALGEQISRGKLPAHALARAGRVLKALPHVGAAAWDLLRHDISMVQGFSKGGWSKLAEPEHRYDHFDLLAFIEQVPDAGNRIELGSERDALGMPKARVHWRWNEADKASVRHLRRVLKEDLESAGLGEVRVDDSDAFCTGGERQGLAHHMGATRMSADASAGVVDSDCRVHGMTNLHIASSSVCTTGSYANPTLTIVALALRLGDHLNDEMTAVSAFFEASVGSAATEPLQAAEPAAMRVEPEAEAGAVPVAAASSSNASASRPLNRAGRQAGSSGSAAAGRSAPARAPSERPARRRSAAASRRASGLRRRAPRSP